jgi:hypothetical protein
MKLLRSKQLYIHLRTDVHFACILAGDEIEITIYLFDVQFRAKFKQYKKRPYSVTVIITTCNIPQQIIKQTKNPFCILCGASITCGFINLNIYSGKRKHFDILQT